MIVPFRRCFVFNFGTELDKVDVYHLVLRLVYFGHSSFFCWLAACRRSYRGTPWQLTHFNVITLYQQQPNSSSTHLK